MYSNVLQSRVCRCLEEVWFGAAIVTCAIPKVTHGCLFTWFSMQKETNDCLWRFQNQALQLLIFLYVESSGICFRLSAVVFSSSVVSAVLENTSCCQELMCNVGICWRPSLATYSHWRKKAMICVMVSFVGGLVWWHILKEDRNHWVCVEVPKSGSPVAHFSLSRVLWFFQFLCSGVLQECSITNAGEHFLLSGMDV